MTLFRKDSNSTPKAALPPHNNNNRYPLVLPPLKQSTLTNGANHTKGAFHTKGANTKSANTKGANPKGVLGAQAHKKYSNGVSKENLASKAKQNVEAYHWQSNATRKTTMDDMVLLTKISEAAITENLKKRLLSNIIYTYIGPVLVAVNPFKQMTYFGEKEIHMYQGAAPYEVPPHIYALADNMYRNMLIDNESQCVIISGESGAGKTVSAKFIMNYITRISGGGTRVQQVKEIIMESNPLLEAFGNAKTIRNNNSSRFGKYIEIEFSCGGEPHGGRISNFLLEKSRVHFLNQGERNFHIFYQLCSTSDPTMISELGLASPDYYNYLAKSGVYEVDGTDDVKEFRDTLKAMSVMGINDERTMDILRVVAAILHLGNISFVDNGNKSQIEDLNYLEFPAFLLGISSEALRQKLTSRVFDSKWGSVSESVDVHLNVEQAQFARDAWAKGLYSRLFDYIVQTVNIAMKTSSEEINLGILDIYGFEIFSHNGFEQFCINYVNEKLQQIFIELTLKNEQEEYKEEGIQWKPIEFFNNKIVCDLIESKRPPGIFSVLDDTVATMSAVTEGADGDFRNKMTAQLGDNAHYQPFIAGFTIKHYAGKVDYHIQGFCEKNRDVLFVDIIQVMQTSSNPFVRSLFPDNVSSSIKGRPTTVAAKIRTQANSLVTKLSNCVPHYIRCIKPNDTKKPLDWNDSMVKDQVEYLGLKENIKVKRAGFAYRRPFEKFIGRYAILTGENVNNLLMDPKRSIMAIMNVVNMDHSQYQMGVSKFFIKDPESLYMMEEFRERKFDSYARVIQRAFIKYYSKQRILKENNEACDVLLNKKQRRTNSINRKFYGDYIGVEMKPNLCKLIPKREKVEFAETVMKYDRRFKKYKRDLILTKRAVYLIGLAKIKKGPQKGQVIEVIKRKLDLDKIVQVTLSTLADNFVLIHVQDDYESLLEINLKTEFVTVLNRKMVETLQKELPRNFINSFDYKVKKTWFGRGGTRRVEFCEMVSHSAVTSSSGSTLFVKIGPHLPVGSRPFTRILEPTLKNNLRPTRRPQNPPPPQPNRNGFPQQAVPSPLNISSRAPMPAPHQMTPSWGRPGFQLRAPVVPEPLMLPTAHQKLPPNAQYGSHVVPPPPSQPAPANQPVVFQKPPIMKPKPKVNLVRALHNYDARDYDEITFLEGDIMELITEDPSGWWTCRHENKEAFCPANYLEKI